MADRSGEAAGSDRATWPQGHGSGTPRRAIWRRVVPLAITAVGLYLVWPSLQQTWSAAPTLRDAHAGWFVAMGALQVASFGCLWGLQRLALDTRGMLLVATSQLASNAIGKIVPAGGAAAAALQHQMLVKGGVDPVRSGTGVTVVAILTNASVFLMPLISLPTILGSTPVDRSLAQAAWIGLAIAIGLVLVASAFIKSDRVLRILGRAAESVANWVRRRRDTGLAERLSTERELLLRFIGERWLRGVGWTIGKLGFDYLSLLAALAAVGADPEPGLVILSYVAAMVLATIPITPGGLGFVEAGLTATLTISGIPASMAATATLAYRLVSYWVPLLAGGPAYLLFAWRFGAVQGGPRSER